MIDPTRITNFDRTDFELQEFWIFSIFVAGKSARTAALATSRFTAYPRFSRDLSLNWISRMSDDLLDLMVRASKCGQYDRIVRALRESQSLNLRTCTIEDLERIHGVGPKTARFFLMHSRPNQNIAALDTHILSYLREQGYKTPKGTPTGKRYYELEQIFLELAKQANQTPADFDLNIWNQRSINGSKK